MERKRFDVESAHGVLIPRGDDLWELANFRARMKRQGHGTLLMEEVIAWADKYRQTIILECGAAPGTMTNMELSMFYRRFGFERVDLKLPIRMIRRIN